MKILPTFDLGTSRSILATDFPDLKIKKIILIDNGWDNMVVEVNGDFRELSFWESLIRIWGIGKYWEEI